MKLRLRSVRGPGSGPLTRTRTAGAVSLLAIGLACAAVAPAANAAGPQSTSQSYTVASTTVPGADTGFNVLSRVPVTVIATGSVNCNATAPCQGVGPDGEPSWPFGGPFLLPSAPPFGLIARIGAGPWTWVGSGPTVLSGSGDLQFAMNDWYFADNSGSFTATVPYTCYPGNGFGDQNHYHCGAPGQQ